MAELAIVVLWKVFDYLSIPERLRIRAICKKWKFVIETFDSTQSLCLYSHKYPCEQSWCFSNEKVTENEMLYLKPVYKVSHRFDLRVFTNLQKIYAYRIGDRVEWFFQEANQLTRLKVLMIEGGVINQIKLSLAGLEKLSLNCLKGHIELDTPNLDSLVIWFQLGLKPPIVKFCFPLKVKHLRCIEFTSDLAQLKNLKTLVCEEITFDFQLKHFESLTRLEIWPTEDQLESIRQIQHEQNRLERSDLELIVSGFKEELVSCSRFNFLSLEEPYLQTIERHRSKFVGIALRDAAIGIAVLVRYANRIPDVLFKHFPRFANIWADLDLPSQIDSQPSLIELIQKCRPRILRIRLQLKDEYSRLSRIESIKVLFIAVNCHNLDCFLNLKNLTHLQIMSKSIPVEFICKAVKKLRFLFKFEYFSQGRFRFCINIWFNNPSETGFLYRLSYEKESGNFSKDFKDVHELVQEIKKVAQNELTRQFFV